MIAATEDLTGRDFGHWTVLYRDPIKNQPCGVKWVCRCNLCGNEHSVIGNKLRRDQTHHCRDCRYARKDKSFEDGGGLRIDLRGQKVGRWTVLEPVLGNRRWLCRCECGTQAEVAMSNLRSGQTTQCRACYLGGLRRVAVGSRRDDV